MTFLTKIIDAFPINTYSDYNFDGYNDIHVHHYGGWSKNQTHQNKDYYYLFDNNNNKYTESKQLESIDISNVCKKDKCLIFINYDYINNLTIYEPFDRSAYNYAKLTKYKWVKDSLKPIETIEETELENGQFSVKETNLIEKTNKDTS